MSDLIVSKKVRQLRIFTIITLVFSVIEFLLFAGYFFYEGINLLNYIIILKFIFVVSDILLGLTVLKLIKNYYPSNLLSVKIQFSFLILAYLSVFGIIIYLSLLYDFLDFLFTVEPIVTGLNSSEDLFLIPLFTGLVLIKIASLVYVQVNGFRLIKDIRKNYRDSLVETSDLL